MKSGINIENPCDEKWDNMQPVNEGAYCGVCRKNVLDFTSKTTDEIRHFFAVKEEGNVCGKFKKTQLLELNFDQFFSRFRLWNLTRRIAVILFFVFGFMLFSCGDDHVTGEVEPVGKVAIHDTLPDSDTTAIGEK